MYPECGTWKGRILGSGSNTQRLTLSRLSTREPFVTLDNHQRELNVCLRGSVYPQSGPNYPEICQQVPVVHLFQVAEETCKVPVELQLTLNTSSSFSVWWIFTADLSRGSMYVSSFRWSRIAPGVFWWSASGILPELWWRCWCPLRMCRSVHMNGAGPSLCQSEPGILSEWAPLVRFSAKKERKKKVTFNVQLQVFDFGFRLRLLDSKSYNFLSST